MAQSQHKMKNTQFSSKWVQAQEDLREEQMVPLLQIPQREQALMKVPPIQQVNPPPLADIEVHYIHSDLEDEEGPSTFPISVLTSMISSIPTLHHFGPCCINRFPSSIFLM